MKSFKILFSVITLIILTSVVVSCKKDEPPVTGCTDKNSLNYNSRATLDDGSCIENNPASMGYTVLLSDSACTKNCQVDKVVRVYLETETSKDYSSYEDFIALCSMAGTFEGIKVPGEYCLNVYHMAGTKETFVKKECFTISQSKIMINRILDQEVILEVKDVCKK